MWSVYLITNGTRTYVGCTTNPARRLRQHNREIKGGARATLIGAGNWKMVLHVEGFGNKSSACRWEALVKKRAKGLRNRSLALIGVAFGICPGIDKGKKSYLPPTNLRIVLHEK